MTKKIGEVLSPIFFVFFLAQFKKAVSLQPISVPNGVMAAQLTLDQLV